MFANLEEYALKGLCKMCDFHIYQDGDSIDLYHGGVIFHGGMKRKGVAEVSEGESSDNSDEGNKEGG